MPDVPDLHLPLKDETIMHPTKEGINAAGKAKGRIPRPMLGKT
jgi:hypothetical protein